jgi:hypothetical protein
MRPRPIDDAWAQQLLDRAEDRLAGARAFTTRHGAARPPRRPPGAARVWLGSLLIAMGHRVLGPMPEPATRA